MGSPSRSLRVHTPECAEHLPEKAATKRAQAHVSEATPIPSTWDPWAVTDADEPSEPAWDPWDY